MTPPSCNETVTALCSACGGPLPAGRPRTTCSDACRQAAWRRRHQNPRPSVDALPSTLRTPDHTVYECPSCDSRALGGQRCDDCATFMRRLGPGGLCPCCDEPITIDELLQ